MAETMHDVLRALVGATVKAGTLGEAAALELLDIIHADDPIVQEEAARPPELTAEEKTNLERLLEKHQAARDYVPPAKPEPAASEGSRPRSLFAAK